jgi:parallel beta-helix repeat protein
MLKTGLTASMFLFSINTVNATVFTASTDSQFAQAMSQAKGGDTILLSPGSYGRVLIMTDQWNQVAVGNSIIRGKAPKLQSAVTVKSLDPNNRAVIKNIDLRASHYWTFDGIDVRPPESGSSFSAVKMLGNNNTIKNSTISFGDSSNWTANDWNNKAGRGVFTLGRDAHVENNYIQSVNMGITFDHGSTNGRAIGNTVDGLAGDGGRALGNFSLFENNLFKNFKAVNANHDDCIQSFSKLNGVIGAGEVVGGTIRGNTCINGEDPNDPLLATPQGYAAFNGVMRDWVIENNILSSTAYHGITFLGLIDSVIRNNTILDNSPTFNGPDNVWIRTGSNGVTNADNNLIANNIANAIIGSATDTLINNHAINIADYDLWFVDWRNFDFTLLPTAPIFGVGAVPVGAGSSVSIDPPGDPTAGLALQAAAFGAAADRFDTADLGPEIAIPLPLSGLLGLTGVAALAAVGWRRK